MNKNVERNTFKTASVSGGILLSLFFLIITFSTISLTFLVNGIGSFFAGFFAFIFLIFTIMYLDSFNNLEPKESRVVQLFGKRKGTFEGEGIHWVLPWYSTTTVSLADSKDESLLIKVPDGRGTPIQAAITFTYRIVDVEKYQYDLEQELKEYLETTTQGCLRNMVNQYPYDSSKEDELTLIRNSYEISEEIEKNINKATSKYDFKDDSVAF